MMFPLVPAKAGTQHKKNWIPACAGMSVLLAHPSSAKRFAFFCFT
jgi:hypothetical protein